MIPELGQFALSLALATALLQTLGLTGRFAGHARAAAQGQALLVAFAFGCLVHAFVANDFSVAYVAMNSNSALPLHYRVAGAWGGHEGSLLLWCLMLGVWMTAVSFFSAHLPEDMVARVLGVLGCVLGSKRGQRMLWLAGAVLMGVVLAKLVLVDRQHLGDLLGIGSFIAYGLLCTLVGYFAPAPPRAQAAAQGAAA